MSLFKCIFLAILIFLFVSLIFVGCSSKKATVTQISEEAKMMVITTIKDNAMVQNAAIVQKGKDISLAIIVNYATSKDQARELGDSFVRLVKTFCEDKSPQKKIGEGIYDYLVGVYYPNEILIVMGSKPSNCDKITW